VTAAPAHLDERRALIDAGISVLRRSGSEGCTVADVLEEAGLSTRAFYRHFGSKDELVLAIYEYDARATQTRLRDRMDAAGSPRAALEVWIDETLALGFDTRRARRTRPLAKEGLRLQAEFPKQFSAIVKGVIDPLAGVLRAFPAAHPERDARSIHAVAWALVAERLAGGSLSRDEAKAHVLRFCLPVIGAAR
jgi:AcrR family transcriptional regulator